MDSLRPRKPISMLSSRPSGVPVVFRREDSKPAATDSADEEYTPADQVFSSRQAMAMDAYVRITLEQRVIETTITDSNVDDMLASECDNFLSEINEQHAFASSIRNNKIMSTESNISDVMDSSVTETSVCKTSTAATDDSDLSMPLPVNVLAYTLSHLHPTVIMETRSESLLNFRRRVHLKEVAAAPFRPISTLNMHLPNDMDSRMPIHCDMRLSRKTLVEFDAFSRGLAMKHYDVNQRIASLETLLMRKCKLREYRTRKKRFKHPTGNHSPLHEAVEYVTKSPVTVPNTMQEDELPTAT
jgi:hypothetical protein